jgi:hypothetical protein
MAIVYQHKTIKDGTIFYVGIGTKINRAYDFNNRGKFWKDFTKNHEFEVEIIHENITYDEAKEIEKALILKLGRRDRNNGNLVNQTDGGDGTLGVIRIFSDSAKLKISVNNGMHNESVKEKHKNSLNRPETKEKQRLAKLGVQRKRILCTKCNNEISDNNYTRHINVYCKQK